MFLGSRLVFQRLLQLLNKYSDVRSLLLNAGGQPSSQPNPACPPAALPKPACRGGGTQDRVVARLWAGCSGLGQAQTGLLLPKYQASPGRQAQNMELTVNYGLLIIWLVGSLWQRPKRPQPSSLGFCAAAASLGQRLGRPAGCRAARLGCAGQRARRTAAVLQKEGIRRRERVECTVL